MTGTPSIHPGMQRWTTILDGGRLQEYDASAGCPRNNSPLSPGSA
jgi:hypothetical protein